MNIRIYDSNNYYRRLLETDTTGLTPRMVMTDMFNTTDTCIWVWDGENGNAKRREVYPGYKANRKPVRNDIYIGFDAVRELLCFTRAIQIRAPAYEADDVIATLSRKYAKAGHTISIYSNDADFLQLAGEYPKQIFVGARPKSSVPMALIRHYKCTVGDPSDNIPGIVGFGNITWERTNKDHIYRLVSAILKDTEIHMGISLSKSIREWVEANRELIKTYWKIVGFYDVPIELIDQHTTMGVEDYAKANAYLNQWMQ